MKNKRMRIKSFHNTISAAWQMSCGFARAMGSRAHARYNYSIYTYAWVLAGMLVFAACEREPKLHLPGDPRDIEIPVVDLELEAYWDYELEYGVTYDWRAEWVYGWDAVDQQIFGEIGYTEPTQFDIRRYYTRNVPYSPHTSVLSSTVKGTTFHGEFDFGFWDILVWSKDEPLNGEVPSLNFNESLDSVTAYTNQSTRTVRYQAPRFTRAFYQTEQLFSAYSQAIEINEQLDGFEYDAERNVYVKRLNMLLEPITYIYLTQVVLRNNRNKIIGIDGAADLSAMAKSTNVNTGISENTPVTVTYNARFKPNVQLESGEQVAIAGGRVMTFGIPGQNGNRIKHLSEVTDTERHYMDLNMLFNNGMDSTFVFDVTNQVRQRWKGGVLTIVLDMDTIPVPRRSGGSAFNAIVKDYEDGGTWEFPM